MKRFNYNKILFAFAAVFIVTGILGKCFLHLGKASLDTITAITHGSAYNAADFTTRIDSITTKELSYHPVLMDIDSVRNNLLGTRVIQKEDSTIVKSNNGSLMFPIQKIDDSTIQDITLCLHEFNDIVENKGSHFLYCAVPSKEFFEEAPPNIENECETNFTRFINELQSAQIPLLDFSEVLKESSVSGSELYYYTDHHWTTRSGFQAANAICEKLSALYGFTYNEQYTELQNYTISHYSDWFLGSRGRMVGTFFSWQGADDFELITPNFETNLTEEQPVKNEVREGSFEETVLCMWNMEKDLYNVNTYVTYSGGDYRLQIMKNNLNPNGKKILLIRDSFACVVAPFLALQTGELHICDIRDGSFFVGDKINIEEYIEKIKPDYVIVLYSGISKVKNGDGRYDFSN